MNIDEFAGNSIVPVLCGSEYRGTGFFISPKHILTAHHVIAETLVIHSSTIFVKIGDELVVCRLLCSDSEPDYALLECVDYRCPEEYVLDIVGGKFREGLRLVIVGYPQELGNGEDYYAVEVKNSRVKKDGKGGFDCMVVRTDSFGFNSYSGFSGSPVINEAGKVVGMQTDQLFNTLGYASVSSFAPFISKYLGREIPTNDAIYDTTPYGLGKSVQHITNSYDKLKTRYNKAFHVPYPKQQKTIEDFCGYGFEDRESLIYEEYARWYSHLGVKFRQYVDSISVFAKYACDKQITDDFRYAIYDLIDKREHSSSFLSEDLQRELLNINRLIESLEMGKRYWKTSKFMCVRGKAGCGKSHLLYYEAKKICQRVHTYFFLGTDFNYSETPFETINRVLKWNASTALEELNQSLIKDNNREAVFIIDAINEGVGSRYWIDNLQLLYERFKSFSQLKLIVSIRITTEDDVFNKLFDGDWTHVALDGFPNREEAINTFFEKNEIRENVTPYLKIDEFDNPLFLKIFCETFFTLTQVEREKALRIPIYKKYLTKRNEIISEGVDEDAKQGVTQKLVSWVANQSLLQYNCTSVPRQSVYKRSKQITYGRTWSKSVLYNCLKENILREYSSSINSEDFIDFEYDSLGDYLKAACLSDRAISDEEKLKKLISLFDIMDVRGQDQTTIDKIFSFLRAFISIWNPNPAIWENKEFQDGKLTSILLSSLHYRNVRDEENTLSQTHIDKIIQLHTDFIEPELILMNIDLYSKGLFDSVHEYLCDLEMHDRDLKWSTKVNALYDGREYRRLIENINAKQGGSIPWTLILVETWMLSSSYPYIRSYVVRKLKEMLVDNKQYIIKSIDAFQDVDDPYIHIGLYSSIYGSIVYLDDQELAENVSRLLYHIHYEDGNAPIDLMVRYWTLKIFEYTFHINPSSEIWKKAQPPYRCNSDLKKNVGDGDYRNETYFGVDAGSKRITRSLFAWDFSRYIIGTNSSNTSRSFFDEDGNAIELSFIEDAIAYLIKNRYGWNEKLGEYDANVPYHTGHDNPTERIGKKYQWLGLNEVNAYLCDRCKVKVNVWSDNESFVDKVYPWYVRNKSYFDPTLSVENDALKESQNLFDVIIPESSLGLNREGFLSQTINTFPLYPTCIDHDGNEWIVLHAYSTIEELDSDYIRERFAFYNGVFVDYSESASFKEWASTKNFYGRWMPEHSGSIDFLWNEYPWSDSYKVLASDDDELLNENGHNFKLAYSAQLQEDTSGMEDSSLFLSTAYMPCAELIEHMRLHTAERGIVRDINGRIIAINRCLSGDAIHALVIRKEVLDDYLRKNNKSLFLCVLGELQYRQGYSPLDIERLTGAIMYTHDNGIEIIQPIRKEPQPERLEEEIDSDEYDGLLPPQIINQLKHQKKSDVIKVLSKRILDSEKNK